MTSVPKNPDLSKLDLSPLVPFPFTELLDCTFPPDDLFVCDVLAPLVQQAHSLAISLRGALDSAEKHHVEPKTLLPTAELLGKVLETAGRLFAAWATPRPVQPPHATQENRHACP